MRIGPGSLRSFGAPSGLGIAWSRLNGPRRPIDLHSTQSNVIARRRFSTIDGSMAVYRKWMSYFRICVKRTNTVGSMFFHDRESNHAGASSQQIAAPSGIATKSSIVSNV